MSTERIGDICAAVNLLPVDNTNLGVIPAAGVGGAPVVSLTDKRAAQASIMALSVSGGGGPDTLDVKFQESDPPQDADDLNIYDGVDDGSEKLRDAGASNVEFAIPFTPSVNMTVYSARIQLSRLGNPTGSVSVALQADAAGDPSGTDLFVSRAVNAANISTSRGEVAFFFDVGCDLTGSTQYWIVISGTYTASLTDCIQVHYDTATSNCKYYDAAWAVMTNQNLWFRVEYLTFTDIAGLVHAQITEGFLNPMDTWERLEIPLLLRKDAMRAFYTPTGAGTWSILHGLNVAWPKAEPLT